MSADDTPATIPADLEPTALAPRQWPTPLGYSLREAANSFIPPISVNRLRRAMQEGTLDVRRCGNRTIVTRAAIETWAATLPHYTRAARRSRTERITP